MKITSQHYIMHELTQNSFRNSKDFCLDLKQFYINLESQFVNKSL